LRRLVIAHTTIFGTWLVLLLLWRDGHWMLRIANQHGPGLLVWSAVVALAAAVVIRRAGVVVTATLPLLILGALYLPYFVPGDDPRGGHADLRVMTFNILNNNDDIDAMATVINTSGADVVAIQELREERVDALVALLADRYPHVVLAPPARGGTTALASTRPFIDEAIIDPGVDRPVVVGTVEIADRPVTILSAHFLPSHYALQEPLRQRSAALGNWVDDQMREVAMILAEIADRPEVVVLACDCNATDTHRGEPSVVRGFRRPDS